MRHVNASANRSGRDRLEAAQAHQPGERVAIEPVLVRLAREVPLEERQLLLDDRLGQRHEDVRRPEVAVDLRDLVLEDQVVAERVPRQLAREPVVLVEVVARVGEHELRVDAGLQILEELLDLAAAVGQEAVAEAVHLDPCRRGGGQECVGARARLLAALARRREHDPVDLAAPGSPA